MAIMTLSIAVLKQAKNAVIGNPTAKRDLARDDDFIQMCVHLRPPSVTTTHSRIS